MRILACLACLPLLALAGCDGLEPRENPAEKVDPEKIGQVAADFHVTFFDADKNRILLNGAEQDAYFTLAMQKRGGGQQRMAPPPPGGYQGDLALSYVDRCKKAGVPIFPALPLKAPPWKKLANLPKKSVFNAPDYQPVEVWRFVPKDKSGVCVALPRYNKDNPKKIQEIGFICQNAETGKACFWAAHDRGTGALLMKPSELQGKKPGDLEGGDKLKLNCTDCHRGYNAFVTHPLTSLGKAVQDPEMRYMPVPVRQRGWANNGEIKLSRNGCGFCHDFAAVTKPWCETVLKPSIGKTMPLNADGDKVIPKAKWTAAIKRDLRKLERLCIKAGLTTGLMLGLE